ncbi:MAG: DNA repair protein RecN [Candidatus Kapaibacteriales bacterium]
MINSLRIKNLAIIKDSFIEFEEGLNIITGETGSGKSLIFKSFSLLSGRRADSSSIRKGEAKALVEAEIYLPIDSKEFAILNEIDPEVSNNFIISRELRAEGANRCFINDSPISLKDLSFLSDRILDIHSQHQSHYLTDENKHIEVLDGLGSYSELIDRYSNLYVELQNRISQIRSLKKKMEESLQQSEYNRFILDELDKINPREDEILKLSEELDILENSEHIQIHASEIARESYDSDDSIYNKIKSISNHIRALSKYHPELMDFVDEIEPLALTAKVLNESVVDIASETKYDPISIESKRKRIAILRKTINRFHVKGDLYSFHNEIREKANASNLYEDKISEQELIVKDILKNIEPIAIRLSEERRLNAKAISEKITDRIKELEMPNGRFEILIDTPEKLNQSSYTQLGLDSVVFMFSANAGQDLKQLSLYASGGEISRLMLAIKAISREESNTTLLFDEIDTGISGQAAIKVGNTIKEISKSRQVISISHLPQVASKADNHILIRKEEKDGDTYSIAKGLSNNDKVKEIARLFTGDTPTENALSSARELIEDYE